MNERRRQAAIPLRDMRYFVTRRRTAQVIANPTSTDAVAPGSTVTSRRGDGRVLKYRIVGENEADPKAGSISFVSPAASFVIPVTQRHGGPGGDSEDVDQAVRKARGHAAVSADRRRHTDGAFTIQPASRPLRLRSSAGRRPPSQHRQSHPQSSERSAPDRQGKRYDWPR